MADSRDMLSQGRSVSSNARLLYAGAAIALFCVEVAIALFVNDAFVRPYVGDVLAILLFTPPCAR